MLGNTITLPSKGVLYPNLSGGEVEVLPMKTGQEELLAGRPEMIPILNALILNCVPKVKAMGMSPLDLISGDRMFLLFMIRKFTYGPTYGFKIKCPGCGLTYRQEIIIPDSLEVTELEEGATSPFGVKLSDDKTEIGFKLLNGHDEIEIERFRNQAFKKGVQQGDPSYTYTIARHIVSIDGKEVTLKEALDYTRKMDGMDSQILQDEIKYIEPGLSRDLELECAQCGYDIETALPFSSEFFRPKLRRRP